MPTGQIEKALDKARRLASEKVKAAERRKRGARLLGVGPEGKPVGSAAPGREEAVMEEKGEKTPPDQEEYWLNRLRADLRILRWGKGELTRYSIAADQTGALHVEVDPEGEWVKYVDAAD